MEAGLVIWGRGKADCGVRYLEYKCPRGFNLYSALLIRVGGLLAMESSSEPSSATPESDHSTDTPSPVNVVSLLDHLRCPTVGK